MTRKSFNAVFCISNYINSLKYVFRLWRFYMKKSKWAVVTLAVAALSPLAVACSDNNKPTHEHSYDGSQWVITTMPDETTGGTASRDCVDKDYTETKDIPNLKDTSVWTKDSTSVAPDCNNPGKNVYKSEYGTVEVVVEKLGHAPTGEWTITEEPSATTGGKSTSACSRCDGTVEKELPSFEDTDFWAHTHADADYNHGTSDTYASDFGTVVKEADDKIAAPYDNKTYYALAYQISAKSYQDRSMSIGSSWNAASLTLGGKNKNHGVGDAHPYRNMDVTVTMTDASKGKVNVHMEDINDPAKAYDFVGYVHEDTGIIIYQDERHDYYLLTPFYYEETVKTGIDDDHPDGTGEKVVKYGYHAGTKASSWTFVDDDGLLCKALAVEYHYGEEDDDVLTFYLEENAVAEYSVYFDSTFEKAKTDGDAVDADKVFNSAMVFIKDEAGEIVNSFGHDGTSTWKLDGFEGTYGGAINLFDPEEQQTSGNVDIELVLDGMGHGTVVSSNQDVDGAAVRYVKAPQGADHTLDVYVVEGDYVMMYYKVTMGDEAFTGAVQLIQVKFVYNTDIGDGVTEKTFTWFAGAGSDVPDMDGDGFMGWYDNEEFTGAPLTELNSMTDITLYARWSTTFINFQVETNGTTEVYKVYYVNGNRLSDIIPEDVIENDAEHLRYLVGWFTEAEGGQQIAKTTVLRDSNSGNTLYAHWAAIPDYSGTYYGVEIGGQANGNYSSSGKNITIDTSKAMTGSKSGTIQSYDPTTQLVTWSSDGSTYSAWFDAESGIFVLNDTNNAYLTTDIYVMSKYYTSGSLLNDRYGIETAATPTSGATARGYYAHIVNMKINATDDADVLFYNDHIYVDVTIINTKGETLDITGIKTSKDVIIKDKLGNIVLAVASQGASFNAQSKTVDLDSYYGDYTVGTETVTLDGAGGVTIGAGDNAVTGRYEIVSEMGDPVFDVFVQKEGVDTVHYVFTIVSDGDNTLVEEKATLTDGTLNATYQINTKIAKVLPTPVNSDATKIFRGWYTDAVCRTPVALTDGKYTMTGNVTLYSKWEEKVTVTVHYNKATAEGAPEDDTFEYAVGEDTNIAKPVSSMKFVGWYTTATFDAGTEWTSGDPIYDDVTIYAKWVQAPPYYKTYYGAAEISGTTANGGVSGFYNRTPVVIFNAEGEAANPGVYPFQNAVTITDYDEATGALIFTVGTAAHRGFVDKTTGILIINQAVGEDVDFGDVWFITPYEGATSLSANVKSSYWNSGKTRVIQLMFEDNTYSYLLNNNALYADVTFEDADGEAVVANDCYNTDVLFVLDSNGDLIVKFAYDGATMQELDGYEDITYVGALGSLTVNGIKTVNIGEKTGTYFIADVSADYTVDVYVDGEYYEITLDKANETYTAVKRMVTLNYVTDYDATNAVSGQVNKNIGVALPVLDDATHFFRGWYTDEACTLPVAVVEGKFVPTAATTTLYAKWDDKVILTLNYGKGMKQRVVGFGEGDAVALDDFKPIAVYIDGQAFVGWSLTDGGTEAVSLTTIDSNTTLYAIWETKDAYVIGGVGTEKTQFTYDATNGWYKSNNYHVGSVASIMSVTANAPGVLSVQYFSSGESNWDNLYVQLNNGVYKKDNTVGLLDRIQNPNDISDGGVPTESQWKSLTYELDTGDTVYFLYGKDSSGNSGADSAWVRNISFVPLDMRSAGEYTCVGQPNVVLDGRGGITRGSETGTYVAISGQGNAYDVFFKNESGAAVSHYKLVVDPTEREYVLTESKVDITYNMNGHGSAIAAASVYTGIEFGLPSADAVTDNGWMFKGWYANAECDGTPVTTVTPVDGETYTYYAKWVQKVKLTVVLGNGLDTVEASFGTGDSVDLNAYKPGYTDGKMFNGWYSDSAFQNAVTETTFDISADTTVYVAWKDGAPFTVESKGPSTSNSKFFVATDNEGEYITAAESSGDAYIAITIYEDGTLKFKCKALEDDNDDYEDCQFRYSVYDTETGTQIGSITMIYSVITLNGTFADMPWKDKEIQVKAGTTIYICFNRASAGRNAQAGIKDIVLE